MTANEFHCVLIGQGATTVVYEGQITRLRYIVADGFTARGSQLRKEGRPDRAGVCHYLASTIRSSNRPPSKRVLRKAAQDIRAVEQALVDGVPLVTEGGWYGGV